jgi:long-chain fatty acid transport protein
MHRTFKGFAFAAAALLAGAPAWAANGHLLHGVGAVNSAMGGAGVALPNDTLGALNLNPALLTELDGYKFEFSAEYNDAKNAVESSVQTPVGTFSGRTEDSGDRSVIPAFGFTAHKPGTPIAFGVGFLGLAGFGVDYAQDNTNPLLAPQPRGFGRVYSNYQLLKIPVVAALQVNPNLSIGASFNAGHAILTADPAGFSTPDCAGPNNCVFPRVNNDGAFGWGVGVGVLYKVTPQLNLGLSYSTEQKYQEFVWNTTVANTSLPTYGTARKVRFKLNAPPILVGGLGYKPTPKLSIALDGKWINYESTDGFKDALGFKDITVVGLGIQFQATPTITVRLGGNHCDSPIDSSNVFGAVPVPAVFQNRITAGFGQQVTSSLTLNLGYYHVFKNRVSGPFQTPAGPAPGTRVTTEMEMDALVATFSFSL